MKVKGLFKKPWAKDLKKEDGPVVDVRDSYSDPSASSRESTYEYYDDADARMSYDVNDRMSMMEAFQQASLYFDYQLSGRDSGGSSIRSSGNSLRLSTGIVNHNITTDESGNKRVSAIPQRRLKPKSIQGKSTGNNNNNNNNNNKMKSSAGMRGRSPMRGSAAPSLETMEEGEEEDSSEDEKPKPPPMPARRRSLSPGSSFRDAAPITRGPSARPGLVRNNSWTSTRDMKKKATAAVAEKPKSKRKPKKDGSKKVRKKKTGDGTSTRPSSSPTGGTKKKKRVGGTDKPRRRKKGDGSSASPVRRKKATTPKRNRSASPETKKTRPGLVRRNSWTSNSNLNANSGETATKIALGNPDDFTIREDEEVQEKDEQQQQQQRNNNVGASKKKPRERVRERLQQGAGKIHNEFMAGLRKSQAIAHSISVVSSKGNVDKEEMERLHKQLQDALDETMRLKEEHDKDQQELGKACVETEELQQMLAESAKENMELWNKLEGKEETFRSNNEKLEAMAKEVEAMREEKKALADTINKREYEIKNLKTELIWAQMDGSKGGEAVGEIKGLQESNSAMQKLIDDHQKELKKRDEKIQKLEDELKLGPQGDEAQKVLELSAELESVQAELKQVKLDHSVELAKKDAMVEALQKEVQDKKSGIEKERSVATTVKEDLATTKDKLNAALAKIEASKNFEKKIQELECRVRDSETMEKGLQAAIDKWTDKAFDWQEKAEKLEAELAQLKGDGGNNDTTGGGGDQGGGGRPSKNGNPSFMARESSGSLEEGIQAVFGGLFGAKS